MKDGGPAFPRTGFLSVLSDVDSKDYDATAQDGMSLRDWLAGQVLPEVMREYFHANGASFGADHFYRNVPTHAYKLADCMLIEREKGGK